MRGKSDPPGLLRAFGILLFWIFLARSLSAQRVVFAHFMLVNQNDVSREAPAEAAIASYQRQIHDAQAIGIDGFALNAGGWFKEPHYIRQASEMFEAAYRLHSHFQLIFSADMCCSNSAADVEDMMRRFAGNPRYATVYYRQHGRFLLTTFAGEKYGPGFWKQIREDLEQGTNTHGQPVPDAPLAADAPAGTPLPVTLVPAFFWGGELPDQAAIERGLKDYGDSIDGSFYWGIAGVPGLGHAPDQVPSSRVYARALHNAGKLYIAPICFQFWAANAARYYEYSGYEGMRALWMDAIETTHPDLVEIITWNDFVEGTYIARVADAGAFADANDLGASAAPPSTRSYFHSHAGAADLMAYYIRWYKTGKKPKLTHDDVYWAYRTVEKVNPEGTPPMKLYGPLRDVVYVTANLRRAARLKVVSGSYVKVLTLPAGSTDVEVPMQSGETPVFQLTRAGRRIAAGSGNDAITADGPYRNLYYSTGSMRN